VYLWNRNPTSKRILNQLNIDPETKVSDLNETNVSALRDILETDEFKLEGDLKRLISLNIKRLIDINSVRGRRHLKGLPVRGQRTRTNNRTRRQVSLHVVNNKNKYVKTEKQKNPFQLGLQI
jgi:small subunit ribosomal protein S13